MLFQRRLLQAMLVLIALAALLAVVATFFRLGDAIARLAFTLTVAAIAAGAARGTARTLDREDSRPLGLAGLGVITVTAVLALLGIWLPMLVKGRDAEFGLTPLVFLPFALGGLSGVPVARLAGGWLSGRVVIAAAGAGGALALLALWSAPLRIAGGERLFATALLVVGVGLAAAASLFGHPKGLARVAWLGPVPGAVALIAGIGVIWSDQPPSALVIALADGLALAIAVGLVNAVAHVPVPAGWRWLKAASAASTCAATVLFMFISHGTDGFTAPLWPDLLSRMFGASVIVASAALLAVALVAAFNRRPLLTRTQAVASLGGLDVICPRCTRRFHAGRGQSACPGCNLLVIVQLAEPRCPTCEYTLLDLRAAACPECGEPVAATLANATVRSPV